jgi:hypothetical protein
MNIHAADRITQWTCPPSRLRHTPGLGVKETINKKALCTELKIILEKFNWFFENGLLFLVDKQQFL